MITETESGLSAGNYASLNTPLTQKEIRLKAALWDPQFTTETGGQGGIPTLMAKSNYLVYDSKIWYVNSSGDMIKGDPGNANVSDTVGFAPTFLQGDICLTTDGTALHALCCREELDGSGNATANVGIWTRYKATSVSAWTAWAQVTSHGLGQTTNKPKWTQAALSTLGTTGTPDGANPVANMNDGASTTYYSNTTVPNNLTFNTIGTYTIGRVDIRARNWDDTKLRKRSPKKFKIQQPSGTTRLNILAERGWKPGEMRSFYLSHAVTGTSGWRIVWDEVNGGTILDVADVTFWGLTNNTVGQFRRVWSPPDNPAVVFVVGYNGPKDAYEIYRMTRSAANFATWATNGATSSTGKLYLQYGPDSINVCQKTDQDGKTVWGVLLSGEFPGPRVERYANETLTFYNEKRNGMMFFMVHSLFAEGGTDAFSDGTFIDYGYGMLSVINNRWTITRPAGPDSYDHETLPISTGLGKFYQSVNGLDWSLPRIMYSSGGNNTDRHCNLVIFNSEIVWPSNAGFATSVNAPLFGGTPSMTTLTGILDVNLDKSEGTSGSFTLDNSSGWLDNHATLLKDRVWYLEVYAALPGGVEALIAKCLTDTIVFEESTTSRRVPVTFRDYLQLMTDIYRAEQSFITDPVGMIPTRQRDVNLQIVKGSGKISDIFGEVTLEPESIVFRADTAEIENLLYSTEQPTGTFIVRGIDADNYIRITTGVSTALVVEQILAGRVFETANLTLAAIPIYGIHVIVRFGALYIQPNGAPSESVYSWLTYVINNTMRLSPAFYGAAGSDTLYRGAVGYYTGAGVTTEFRDDCILLTGRMMSVEDTVIHLAARAGIFSTANFNILKTTTGAGGWTLPPLSAMTIVTSTDQFKRLDSLKLTTTSASAWVYATMEMEAIDRKWSFLYDTAGSNLGFSLKIMQSDEFYAQVDIQPALNRIMIIREGDGIVNTETRVALRRFAPTGVTKFDIGFVARPHPSTVSYSPLNNDPMYSWYFGIVVYANGQLVAGYCETVIDPYDGQTITIAFPATNLATGFGTQNSTAVGTIISNPRVSSLQQWSDPIVLDPGETPMASLARTTEGLNLRLQMRYNGALGLFAYYDNYLLGIQKTILRAEQFDPIVITYDRANLMNHARLVGAYVEAEYIDNTSVRTHGHRFQVIHNPYMYSQYDCLIDATRRVKQSIFEAEVTEIKTHFLPFLETGDNITVKDQADASRNIAITNQGIGANFVAPSHTIVGRKTY